MPSLFNDLQTDPSPEPSVAIMPTPSAAAESAPDDTAVLSLSESGEILAAEKSCYAVFGWEAPALAGQNVRVLLQGGLDNEVGLALHRHAVGGPPAETTSFRVIVRRRDGFEWHASVTTLAWKSGPVEADADAGAAGAAKLHWSAAFRRLEPVERPRAAASPAPPVDASETDRLRQERDALHERLRQMEAEAAAARDQAEQLAGNRAHVEGMLKAEMEAAKEASAALEAALGEETQRREKLEERLQSLSLSLRQEQLERSQRFDQELITLRQHRDELNSQLAAEQEAAAESTRRAEELETRLRENAVAATQASAQLEQQDADRARSESAWREQLDTAWVEKKQIEGAWAGAVERNKQVEQELEQLRQQRDALNARLAAEQQTAAASRLRAREVEGNLGRNAEEFERTRSELEQISAERDQAEADWRDRLDKARAQTKEIESAWAAAVEKHVQSEEQLAALRRQLDESHHRLKTEQQAAAEVRQRADDWQHRCERAIQDTERLKADVSRRNADHDRLESGWTDQLDQAKALAKKLQAAWTAAVERNRQLEDEHSAVRRERDELETHRHDEQRTNTELRRRVGELEGRLQKVTSDLEVLRRKPSPPPSSAPAAPHARAPSPAPAPPAPAEPSKRAVQGRPAEAKLPGPGSARSPAPASERSKPMPAPGAVAPRYDLKP